MFIDRIKKEKCEPRRGDMFIVDDKTSSFIGLEY
jgi:hypothetical protein